MSRTKAMQVADREYSRMIRIVASDPHTGMSSCITCNERMHWSRLDCGHFITRAKQATRYEPMNTWPQCQTCNRHHNGRRDRFEAFLNGMLGEEMVQELKRRSQDPMHYTTEDLQEMARLFRKLAKDPPTHRCFTTFPHPN